jgi:3',5'-cyclic AMP phosphodiesterase CpdA
MWRRAAFILVVCGLVGFVVLWSSSGSSGLPGGPGRRTGHTARTGPRVLHTSVSSRFVHARLPLTLLVPAGSGAGRPLLVFLHGHGGGPNSELSEQLFAALRSVGARAPDIAFPDGGVDSYWHNRASGDWGSYVLDEVIPQAIRMLHAEPRRVAIGGISMGGFGAYAIARMDPSRFCAVGGHSAAIFPAAALTAPGAFDDASDFAHHDLIAFAAAHPHPYGSARLWLDGGSQDPFHKTDETFAAELHVPMHVWPGAHDNAYWNAHWQSYIRFYADALAHCR